MCATVDPGDIVAATYGGKGADLLVESGVGEKLTTAAGQLLQQAREIQYEYDQRS